MMAERRPLKARKMTEAEAIGLRIDWRSWRRKRGSNGALARLKKWAWNGAGEDSGPASGLARECAAVEKARKWPGAPGLGWTAASIAAVICRRVKGSAQSGKRDCRRARLARAAASGSVSLGAGLGEAVDFLSEFIDIAELLIDACEADVGDLVDGAEALHDTLADGAGRDDGIEFALEVEDDIGDEHFDLVWVDRAFFGSAAEAVEDFGAVEGFAAAIIFDDGEVIADNFLSGGKAVITLLAEASAADGEAGGSDA